MKNAAQWPYPWSFYLAGICYFTAAVLRSILLYQDDPKLIRVLGTLLIWGILAASEPYISNRWPAYFPIYITFQTTLIFWLITTADSADFIAILFNILSMVVMSRLDPKIGVLWIALCALIMELVFARTYGNESIALTLIYSAGNAFFGFYALATRRAETIQKNNQSFVNLLQDANQQLQAYSTQLEQLTVARERNRLARELHDSVTQTVFSMTLATKSAILVLDREPAQVRVLLDRLGLLAQNALFEMRLLISRLQPENISEAGLVLELRKHLASSHLFENLAVSLQVEGDGPLMIAEEQGLFRILQESLNNILKHAHSPLAQIQLHLEEPFWVEVKDQGRGFEYPQVLGSGGIGLSSMSERAEEIGWHLKIITAPGAGTCIRVEKLPSGGSTQDGIH